MYIELRLTTTINGLLISMQLRLPKSGQTITLFNNVLMKMTIYSVFILCAVCFRTILKCVCEIFSWQLSMLQIASLASLLYSKLFVGNKLDRQWPQPGISCFRALYANLLSNTHHLCVGWEDSTQCLEAWNARSRWGDRWEVTAK